MGRDAPQPGAEGAPLHRDLFGAAREAKELKTPKETKAPKESRDGKDRKKSAKDPEAWSQAEIEAEVQELDQRRRADLELLQEREDRLRSAIGIRGKARDAEIKSWYKASAASETRPTSSKKAGSSQACGGTLQERIARFRKDDAKGKQRKVSQQVVAELEQFVGDLARYVEELEQRLDAEKRRHVEDVEQRLGDAERRAEAADAALHDAEERFAAEEEARQEVERLRSAATRRVEELELANLELLAQREQWRQQESELSVTASGRQGVAHGQQASENAAIVARDARIRELEALLKKALYHGAKLGRERADVEAAKADVERRLSRLRELAKEKMRQQRRRFESQVRRADERAERAEDRLAGYFDASLRGAEALAEAHIQHLIDAGQGLAQQVEEQTETIAALEAMLQDHKSFIRQELGDSLCLPSTPEATDGDGDGEHMGLELASATAILEDPRTPAGGLRAVAGSSAMVADSSQSPGLQMLGSIVRGGAASQPLETPPRANKMPGPPNRSALMPKVLSPSMTFSMRAQISATECQVTDETPTEWSPDDFANVDDADSAPVAIRRVLDM